MVVENRDYVLYNFRRKLSRYVAGKRFVITGVLDCMEREEAADLIKVFARPSIRIDRPCRRIAKLTVHLDESRDQTNSNRARMWHTFQGVLDCMEREEAADLIKV